MTGVAVQERTMAGLRWLTLAGERSEVFHTLGGLAQDDIHAVMDEMPERAGLIAFVNTGRGRALRDAVVQATKAHHPDSLRELQAMANGAGVPFDELLLANLRGDLGLTDGTGCTDLAWCGERSYIAHNEDGAPGLASRLTVLTLHITGTPAVTVHWYPGFVPSNTVAHNEAGMAWGINHIQARIPAAAGGRHFVARDLQTQTSLDAVCGYLRKQPTAGGFSYTIGQCGTADVAVVEAVAGNYAEQRCAPDKPALSWHTNHVRQLDPSIDAPPTEAAKVSATDQLGGYQESVARGHAADDLPAPTGPVAEWLQTALTGGCTNGIHRTAAGTDPLMTLTTTVTDLTERTITVRSHHEITETFTLSEYLNLDPSGQQAH